MRAQEDLGSFAEFEFEKIMKRTCASTRLRLYPHPDVQSRLLRPPIMHNADGVSVRNTDDVPGKLSSTVATTQVRLRSSKARNEIENDGEGLAKTGLVTPIFGSDSFSNLERPLCLLSVVVAEQIVTMIKDDPF
jgi:hypothetical protein